MHCLHAGLQAACLLGDADDFIMRDDCLNALLCLQGCKLHASWDDGDFIMRDDIVLGWLESPAWVNPSLPLSSLWLRSEGVSFDQEAERLCEVLSGGRDLDSVSLIVYKFGTHDSPIEISERCRQGLLSAKTRRIRSNEGCFLWVTGSNPCWEPVQLMRCCRAGGVRACCACAKLARFRESFRSTLSNAAPLATSNAEWAQHLDMQGS